MVIYAYTWPKAGEDRDESAGKFLQLRLRRREYLVFAPFELHRYHNQILAHFLADNGIDHTSLDKETLEYERRDVSVVGGGRYRVHTRHEMLELWDDSQVYGRFDARGLADRIAAAGHRWSGFVLRIS